MNVKTVKDAEKRIDVPSIAHLGIQAYNHNNLYPQDIKAIVANSESGASCLNRYVQFIQGNGFKDVAFAETVLNAMGDTADDILQQVADDLASFDGFALHVNYDALGEIVEVYHVPFENCRLGEEDEQGFVSRIAVFVDWSGTKRRGTKVLRPTRDTVDYIDIFNPDKDTVQKQIADAGGLEAYKGQILWVSSAGKQEYPKAVYDCVVTQMSTEEGLSNIAYRNTRNNFNPSGMLVTKRGMNISAENEESAFDSLSIAEEVAKIQGDVNTNKILHVEVEYDEEVPQFVSFGGTNYDQDYSVTSDTACEKIYSAFGQEAWHRIRKGSLGFSSEVLVEAYENYSTVTGTQRRMIERAFDKIFRYWHMAVPTTDFTIEPLKYVSSETTDNN
ncbi:hypothetical protein M2132_000819 [Dysgonomonas sp. PH5-45]|uniref:hypothetical protein n=1 Tax=unclassified Dysgonomonas TaxID=2630389 RepID=UPI002474C2EC|nr:MULTISPECIES: hypothetical protein [unclassified Dysgonomonas]MDH6354491.1 hypothetical protein [Dysgonomonas sp. PH5-45]MDH6387452.1 hypothetical protein [Dysgonomonas sp. PH5-37]